ASANTSAAMKSLFKTVLLVLVEHRRDHLPRTRRRLVGRREDGALLERHAVEDQLLLLDDRLVLGEGAVDADAKLCRELRVLLLEAARQGPEVVRRARGLRSERVQHPPDEALLLG